MNRKLLGGVLILAVVAGLAWVFLRDAKPAARPQVAAPADSDHAAADPGGQVLRFASGARQLAAIKVIPAVTAPVPLSEPLPGRIAYNENLTSRLSVPIAGRVTAVRADAGYAGYADLPEDRAWPKG